MAKPTSCKEAIANFEKAKGVVAAETDKVQSAPWFETSALPLSFVSLVAWRSLKQCHLQILLYGQVPSIDKMDASLSSLKACK